MEQVTDYQRIERAIKYLIENCKRQPSLNELAAHIGVSSFHFQRMFTRWAGVSPKKFLKHLTIENLKKEIAGAKNINEAAEQAGLSSQSRVYDLFVNIEAVTPNEYKTQGKGTVIEYGFTSSPFGKCFIASTERGICAFQFTNNDEEKIINELKDEWNNARFQVNDSMAEDVAQKVFYSSGTPKPLNLFLKGTPFQIKIWRALIRIPFGNITTYAELAKASGDGNATRAVASAVARNPVGYIIPCHRVIRSEGVVGQYHWKPERKAAIIAWEKSQ